MLKPDSVVQCITFAIIGVMSCTAVTADQLKVYEKSDYFNPKILGVKFPEPNEEQLQTTSQREFSILRLSSGKITDFQFDSELENADSNFLLLNYSKHWNDRQISFETSTIDPSNNDDSNISSLEISFYRYFSSGHSTEQTIDRRGYFIAYDTFDEDDNRASVGYRFTKKKLDMIPLISETHGEMAFTRILGEETNFSYNLILESDLSQLFRVPKRFRPYYRVQGGVEFLSNHWRTAPLTIDFGGRARFGRFLVNANASWRYTSQLRSGEQRTNLQAAIFLEWIPFAKVTRRQARH